MLTRFAPAPTGYLHLGHVVNAIYVWGLAATMNAEVLLRIEDHDRQRSKPVFEAAILDDLDWLGFRPDRYATASFRSGRSESRQSDRGAVYASVADDLRTRGLLYACDCSRHQRATAAPNGASRLAYTGRCRDRGLPLAADVAWRVRLHHERAATWTDRLNVGDTSVCETWRDPVIRDRRGNWTYQFAVVVDDHRQGVDLVIRGEDLVASTPLQIHLARLIGRKTPAAFAHHPLAMHADGRKLSKSDGDTGFRDLRADGCSAAEIIGRAAHAVGLTNTHRPIAAGEVSSLFAGRAGR